MAAEVGEPNQRQRAHADTIARRIRDRSLDRVSRHVLVLDSGGLSRLSARTKTAAALIGSLVDHDLWPPIVPTMVLVESLHLNSGRDANTNRFLNTCTIEPDVREATARRAAQLRRLARKGSAVDALVVALAESGGTVLTGDRADFEALAAHADRVAIEII